MCCESYPPEVPKACWNELRNLAVRQHVVVYGITMTVEGNDTGYGSHIGLCVVEGNEASCRTRHQLALFRATHKTNELFHSINILLYSVPALCESCVHCVTYVIRPWIITLFTNSCQVQLMRRGSSKVKDSLRCEPHLEKPKQGGCTLWGVCLCDRNFWFLDWYRKKTLSRKKTRSSTRGNSIDEVGNLQTLTQSVSKCGKQSLWSWSQSRLLPEQFAITRL